MRVLLDSGKSKICTVKSDMGNLVPTGCWCAAPQGSVLPECVAMQKVFGWQCVGICAMLPRRNNTGSHQRSSQVVASHQIGKSI